MQTTLRSAFITDLILPPPNSLPHLKASQISGYGYDAALGILQSPEAFIRSNPLVTNVRPLKSPSDSKNYIDVPHWCTLFNLNPAGDPERGISGDWEQFEITDKLNWGLGSSDLVYVTAMRRIPGGFESVTSPGSGVRIYGRFEILRPNELSRLSSTPTHTSTIGANGDAEADTTAITNSEPQKGAHDYSINAPNAVPGWSDPSTRPQSSGSNNLRPPAAAGTSSATSSRRGSGELDNSGIIHFIEHNETRCNKMLSLYIKATTAKSHRHMHENFKRRWGEIVKDGLSSHVKEGLKDWAEDARKHVRDGERKLDGVQGVGVDVKKEDNQRGRGLPVPEGQAKRHERTGSEMRTTLR